MYTLLGVNGNAFAIMGYVINAMRACGKTQGEINKYKEEAMKSDYNNLLVVSENMCRRLSNECDDGNGRMI